MTWEKIKPNTIGYDGSNRVNDFYEFKFTRKGWSVVLAAGVPPTPRDRHVCVVYKDAFVVFAGFDGSSRVNDLIEFNFCTFSLALSAYEKLFLTGSLCFCVWL